jgi:hypothetical protein
LPVCRYPIPSCRHRLYIKSRPVLVLTVVCNQAWPSRSRDFVTQQRGHPFGHLLPTVRKCLDEPFCDGKSLCSSLTDLAHALGRGSLCSGSEPGHESVAAREVLVLTVVCNQAWPSRSRDFVTQFAGLSVPDSVLSTPLVHQVASADAQRRLERLGRVAAREVLVLTVVCNQAWPSRSRDFVTQQRGHPFGLDDKGRTVRKCLDEPFCDGKSLCSSLTDLAHALGLERFSS